VIEAMGTRLCELNPNKAVKVTLECSYIDREPMTYGGFDICSVPEL
jgi:hypothetical protein